MGLGYGKDLFRSYLRKSLAGRFSQLYAEVLVRNRETKTQVGLSKKQRGLNVSGVFGVKIGSEVKGKDVLLVDDVFTSGATMAECSKVLKKAGAKSV